MLVAPNLSILEENGFEHHGDNCYYYYDYLGSNEEYNGCYVSLIVNPYIQEHKENEVFIYVGSDALDDATELDFCVRLDKVFELLSKGVIKWAAD